MAPPVHPGVRAGGADEAGGIVRKAAGRVNDNCSGGKAAGGKRIMKNEERGMRN
jgi:hypothetical protein